MLSTHILKLNLGFRRLIAYNKLFANSIASPQNYNISLDALRKENRTLLLANRQKSETTEEINKTYNVLKDDMSRYILYLNTLSPQTFGSIDASNIESDPRLNNINDFEFLEEIMDTMEQIDSLESFEELNTIKQNVAKEYETLKQGIEKDFKNRAFIESVEKFQKLKYLRTVSEHAESRVDALEDVS